MRRHFTLVLKGHIAIAEAVFPVGTTGAQLDTLARMALWRAGLDYDHGTGHGVGSFLCVHEGPARLSKTGAGTALAAGMILSNEPGYYRAGHYGIRIENLVAVRKAMAPEGAERELLAFDTLSLCPIDRRLIATELLTDAERAWVDAYHARVARELSPLVDGATRPWLAAACAPLA
jgi:Xaa-Pro aminopeptidase